MTERGQPGDLNGLAWFLATCEMAELRDGKQAIALAQKAVALRNDEWLEHRRWSFTPDARPPAAGEYLDTLAAAYAETGDFNRAIAAEKQALALPMDQALKPGAEARLKLYQAKRPYREGFPEHAVPGSGFPPPATQPATRPATSSKPG